MPRLRRTDFLGRADNLAADLLGCTLVHQLADGTRLAGVIIETEAYLGAEDRAAHSYGNRRTARTEPMFAAGGTAYVYFTYGMHHCMNVSAATEGDPQAVLIRALQPTEGVCTMREIRARSAKAGSVDRLADHLLCSGPGRICRAMGIDRSHSGLDMTRPGPIWIERVPGLDRIRTGTSSETRIVQTPRIGLGECGEWKDAPLRFVVDGHRSVSGGRIRTVVGSSRRARTADNGRR